MKRFVSTVSVLALLCLAVFVNNAKATDVTVNYLGSMDFSGTSDPAEGYAPEIKTDHLYHWNNGGMINSVWLHTVEGNYRYFYPIVNSGGFYEASDTTVPTSVVYMGHTYNRVSSSAWADNEALDPNNNLVAVTQQGNASSSGTILNLTLTKCDR